MRTTAIWLAIQGAAVGSTGIAALMAAHSGRWCWAAGLGAAFCVAMVLCLAELRAVKR